MSVSLGVLLKIKAKDSTSNVLNRIGRASDRNAAKMSKNWKKASGPLMSYGKLLGSILSAKVLSRGFAMAEQGVMAVGASIVQLDQSLTSASVKFGSVADRGSEGWKVMEAQVKEMGRTTEFTSAQVAQGLDFMAMAGFNYTQSLAMMPKMIDLATVAQIDLARASDIASDAIGTFGLDKTAKDMQRVSDVFTKTVTSSNTTMETLFDTMKMSGPVVINAGGDMETWAALTGKMGSAGIKGTRAATAIKNAYMRLADPVGKASTAMKKLGIDAKFKNGDMRDMVDILDDVGQSMKGLSFKTARGDLKPYAEVMKEAKALGTGDSLKALGQIFGKRAVVGVASVLQGNGVDEVRKTRDALYDIEGISTRMADKTREGLGVQIELAKSAAMAKGHDIFAQLMGGKDPAKEMKKLVEIIRNYDVTPIVDILKTAGKWAKWLFEILRDNWDMVVLFTKAMVGLKALDFGYTAYKNLSGIVGLMRTWISLSKSKALTNLMSNGLGGQGMQGPMQAGGSRLAGKPSVMQNLTKGGASGVFNVVIGVAAAAVIGAAFGSVVWKYFASHQEKQAKKESELGGMISGPALWNIKNQTGEELSAKLTRLDTLATEVKLGKSSSQLSAAERQEQFKAVAEYVTRARQALPEKIYTDEMNAGKHKSDSYEKKDRQFLNFLTGMATKRSTQVSVVVTGPEGTTAAATAEEVMDAPRVERKALKDNPYYMGEIGSLFGPMSMPK